MEKQKSSRTSLKQVQNVSFLKPKINWTLISFGNKSENHALKTRKIDDKTRKNKKKRSKIDWNDQQLSLKKNLVQIPPHHFRIKVKKVHAPKPFFCSISCFVVIRISTPG